MKWLIFVITVIVLVNSIAAIARQEKIIKKPLGLKPTKQPKTIIEEFRNLSPADVEFIKQVDKQFKVHGDKIKIKVERENATVINKNTKRTIDGVLGYGHYQNQPQQGYYFSQPHMMHKFTMHDLPGAKNGYHEKATDIEIQQSHSYEITEQTNYQPTGSQSYQHEQVYEDPVPVIVLRIPGPQKYALHLQALLQQYLEIRASQYIKALEDQERRGHLQHPQHYVPQHQTHVQQHMQYMSMYVTPMYHHAYYQTQPQPQSGYQQYYQVNHGNNYAVPAGEQSYYAHQQPAQQEYQHQQAAQEYHHQQSPQEYHQQQPAQDYHQASPQPQPELPSSYINFVTPAYDQADVTHQTHHEQAHYEQGHLEQAQSPEVETNENYPSEKHTQVIFKKKKNRVHRPSITYQQPEPIVVPDPPQQHEAYQEHHQQVQQLYAYTNNFNEHSEEAEHVVAVTQRSQSPVNYHVLKSTLAPTQEELHERHNPKRMTAPFTKEQFEKARKMMTKSKRNRGSLRQEKQIEKVTEAPKS